MLRRPPTVLSLTADDLKAYEDRHEAEAFKAALEVQKQTLTPNTRHPNQINNNTNTTTTTTSSSSYEDISEANNGLDDDEDSYYPRRYRTIDNEDDGDIYRNEVDASPSSNSASAAADGEDQVMTELAPEELEARESSAAPASRFGRRGAAAAAAAITPTPGVTPAGRAYGAASVVTPEAPARQTRSRDERITGRGARR